MFYIPRAFKITNIEQLHTFMQKYVFSSVISHSTSISVSHVPLLLRPNEGKYGTLFGHIAKANSQWKDFDGKRPSLCIFNGPHAYISPTWYQKRPEVPTWNYTVVHAQGIPKIIDNEEELSQSMNEMINYFEPLLQDPKSSSYIPELYKKRMIDHIIGFKIEIQELVGKFKLGQNRTNEDQQGLLEGLSKQADNDSKQLAEFLKTYNIRQ